MRVKDSNLGNVRGFNFSRSKGAFTREISIGDLTICRDFESSFGGIITRSRRVSTKFHSAGACSIKLFTVVIYGFS